MKTKLISLFIIFSCSVYSQNTGTNENKSVKYKELSVPEFTLLVNNSTRLVLVHFEADWCALCKKLKPILEEIAIERKDKVKILHINTDDNPKIAKHFEIDGLPIMILYKNGKIIWSMQGFLSKKEILGNLDLYQ